MAAEALEQSMLESKDKEQLLAIAQALGIKTTSRAAKATLIDKILETTGGGSSDRRSCAAFDQRPRHEGVRRKLSAAVRLPTPRPTAIDAGPDTPTADRATRRSPKSRRLDSAGRSRSHARARRRAARRLGDRADQVGRGGRHRARRLTGSIRSSAATTSLDIRRPRATTVTATAMPRAATAAGAGAGATRVGRSKGRRAAIRSVSSARIVPTDRRCRPPDQHGAGPGRPATSICATRATASFGSPAIWPAATTPTSRSS